ncbi:MAG: hypothetical protein ACR2IE_15475 [Candidatus Sumerlaeaceae bacterium]
MPRFARVDDGLIKRIEKMLEQDLAPARKRGHPRKQVGGPGSDGGFVHMNRSREKEKLHVPVFSVFS